jgi:septal ring factor EnvC (AmiA/AmiB activator)
LFQEKVRETNIELFLFQQVAGIQQQLSSPQQEPDLVERLNASLKTMLDQLDKVREAQERQAREEREAKAQERDRERAHELELARFAHLERMAQLRADGLSLCFISFSAFSSN